MHPPLIPASIVRRSPSARDAEAGGDLVLLDPGRSRYFTLNASGRWIWQRLAGGATLGELRDALAGEFDLAPEQAWRDLLELITDLATEALIVIDGEPPAAT